MAHGAGLPGYGVRPPNPDGGLETPARLPIRGLRNVLRRTAGGEEARTREMAVKRSSLATLATLALLALVAASVWIHRIHIDHPNKMGLITSDTYRYFYPTALYLHEQLQQGKIPLWNPYPDGGTDIPGAPTTGSPYSSPTLLPTRSLSPEHSLGAHVVLHVFIAGFFTWLLATRMGLGLPSRRVRPSSLRLQGPHCSAST